MFRCGKCEEVSYPGEQPVMVVTQVRQVPPVPGMSPARTDIVKEVRMHSSCALTTVFGEIGPAAKAMAESTKKLAATVREIADATVTA